MWLLIVLALLTRLPYLWGRIIPFSFDHGRDSLAALHLIKTLSLKFIGPWTSIPGLFFGPGWYYLLAPAYWLSGGDPISGTLLMVALGLVQIGLAYKYLGVYEAVIMATAPIWIILSTGAANPFPMTLVSLIIIILLKQIGEKRKVSVKQMALLGLMIGLGFHFSSAFSIFYFLTIPIILGWRKIKLTGKKVVAGFGALVIAFGPQLLFEIKHGFMQTKAVIGYFSEGETQKINPGKIKIVTNSIINELGLAVLPDIKWLKYLGLGLLIIGTTYLIRANLIRAKKKNSFWPEIILLLAVPTVGFWWLHYNPWYAYGFLPVAVVAVGKILRALPKKLAMIYLLILLISPIYGLYNHFDNNREKLLENKAFLPVKMEVLEYIYSQAGDQSFASYHYLPEIYDYAYQYLYLWQGFKGRTLPVEFSYQPGEISYATEKPDLLDKLPKTQGPAEKIFLVIERPENKWHYPLDEWLGRIEYREIISKQLIGPEIEVWQVMAGS